MTQSDFISQAQQYLNRVGSSLSSSSLSLKPHWSIDHICYRTNSFERYPHLKNKFCAFATPLIESEINNRPITTFKLLKPLTYKDRTIDLVELPAPKPDNLYPDGFEHIEVVCDENLIALASSLNDFKIKKSGLNKFFNPELACNINGICIKFHHMSLESVATLESNTKVFNAILESNILNYFKDYLPKIVGTFPLDIFTDNSDIDIILYSNDLSKLEKELKFHYDSFDGFNISSGEELNNKYLITNFTINNIPIEIFAQKIPTTEQRAFIHFQVEERLLKIGGPSFKEKIKKLRAQNIKTEPAFAKVLGLAGDPYIALTKLFKYSEKNLKDLLIDI